MDQYTNYLDALSHSMYSQQAHTASPFLSSESQPPSLSASPVSSEGSDSLADDSAQYGLFGYDHSPSAIYSPYNENSANNFMSLADDHSSPSAAVKHEDPFGYDSQMMFGSSVTSSLPTYRQPIGYTAQERASAGFNYLVPPSTISSLANALADSTPYATVAPSATFGPPEGDTSAYKLSAGIAELSISSPVSSPFFAASVESSPTLIQMSQPQQIQVCDPQALGSPVDIEQPIIQAGLSVQVEESRRSMPPTYSAPVVDSDYAPSGESEVEDENDYDYGAPSNRKKNRSARVSCAAHPYLKPASKSKDKRRATLEIPVPVPGLTKNSRGRSVPTGTPGVVYVDGTRSFWCSVQNCNKMFSRGEHLKRHIKSIHTHDKDYRCECKNTFSRRDNLFQHMRTKGCQKWYEDVHGKSSTDGTAAGEDVEEDDDARVDRLVERMMNDAKIAQEKRIKACKRALAHS